MWCNDYENKEENMFIWYGSIVICILLWCDIFFEKPSDAMKNDSE